MLLALALFGAASAPGQVVFNQLLVQANATGRAPSFVYVRNLQIANHVFEWSVVGSPASCTLLIEKSADASSWSTESSQTCTSSGKVTLSGTDYVYLTVNLSVFSGGSSPNISVSYGGYRPGQGLPVREGEGGTGSTTVLTTGSVLFKGTSGYAQDNANFFFDDTNNRLCLLSNTCSNTFDVGGGKMFVTSTGELTANKSTLKATNSSTIAATVQGAAAQTADLHVWENSAGTDLGSVDKDGNIKGTRGNQNVPLSGTPKADPTVTTVSNTITESALNSYAIPANTLALNRTVRIRASGVYSTANGTDTVTLNFRVAGTTWHTIVSTAASVTNVAWSAEWLFTMASTGAGGTAESQLLPTFINGVLKTAPATATKSIDTTLSRTADLTATWSAALSGNTISVRQWVVEFMN